MPENTLPYPINDADNHFNEPLDCFERYIDPSKIDLAIRYVTAPDGKRMQLFAGQPSKFHSDQVTFSKEELEKMLGDTSNVGTRPRHGADGRGSARARRGARHAAEPPEPAQGPQRGGAQGVRRRVPQQVGGLRQPRSAPGADGRPGHRQGAHVPGSRARHRVRVRRQHRRAVRQHPRRSTAGCTRRSASSSTNRMWLPPYISFADPDLAIKELEIVLEQGATADPDQVGSRARRRRQPVRWSLARRSRLRPVLEHRERGRRRASRCTSAAPTTRSTAPTGPKTPRPSSATSTPSSG